MHYAMNNMKKIFVVYCFFLFALNTSYAQSQDNIGSLSLEQCIQIAQDQSPVALAARYALESSRWQHQSYRADLLPSLSISGDAPNYNKSLSLQFADGAYEYFDVRQSDAAAEVSVNQNLVMTGGTLSLSSGITKLGIFEGEDRYRWQSNPLVVGYTQPIFGFNDLRWRRRTEPLRYEIAQKEYVEDMEGVAINVTNSFFDVLLAQINLENAEFNVTRNDSIYQISQGRYNVGSIAENELLQSELALRNAEASLTRARLEYERSLNDFKIILGYPTSVELSINAPKNLPEIDITVPQAKQLAIRNNSEALNYRLEELQADRDYAQAKSESNLSATLSAHYGLNQTSGDFADLYKNPDNRQFITMGFEVPIFNWGKQQAQINAARNQQREVANSIEFQRRQFNQEVQYTVSRFLQLKDQVLLAAQSDTIAQRRYQVAQNRYTIGTIDITDLFNAQNDRSDARQGYIQALRDFWIGWYELRQLTLYNFETNEPIRFSNY